MTRVQTQYQGRGEQTQAVQSQTLQPVQARYGEPQSGAYQLAKALGALDTSQLKQSLSGVDAAQHIEARQQAEKFANSITVDELGKRVKSGEMLPSNSPAFMGALQHIYGENTQQNFERDTFSKIQTGELSFGSQEEMDAYLTKGRNDSLEGQSKYAIAGFDKGYGSFREKAITANAKFMNDKAVERGLQESSDKLGNDVLKVTAPEFKGTPEDGAKVLLKSYKLLTGTSLLRDDARKEALNGILTNLAGSGHKDLAEAVLKQDVGDGVSVRAVIGEQRAVAITNAAQGQYDNAQRQRVDVELRPFLEQADKGELDEKKLADFAGQNEKYITTQTLHAITNGNRAAQDRLARANAQNTLLQTSEATEHAARQNVAAATASGTLAFLPQQKYLSHTGEEKTLDHDKVAAEVLTQQTSKWELPQQVEAWSKNDVENPEWAKEISGGAANVASVGWAYDGKNIGQLNPQGQKALDTFMKINATDPKYAEKLAKKDYQLLSDIQFMVQKGGFPNVNDAASMVNQATRGDIKSSDYGSMTKNVASAVDDVVNPGFWSARVSWWNGLFGNDQTNLTSMHADIRRRAELLVMSGQYKDAGAAVEATVKYLADPAVTTKVNNTLYYNKDMPTVPKGEDPGKLLERYIKEVPGKIAKDQKMSGDVRLEANKFGGFTAFVGGVPMMTPNGNVFVVQKQDISKWADMTVTSDINFRKEFADFKNRTSRELAKSPRKTMENGDNYVVNTLNTEEGYRKIIADGNQNKPVSELYKIYRPKNQ